LLQAGRNGKRASLLETSSSHGVCSNRRYFEVRCGPAAPVNGLSVNALLLPSHDEPRI
jgi:hypothetical protein